MKAILNMDGIEVSLDRDALARVADALAEKPDDLEVVGRDGVYFAIGPQAYVKSLLDPAPPDYYIRAIAEPITDSIFFIPSEKRFVRID